MYRFLSTYLASANNNDNKHFQKAIYYETHAVALLNEASQECAEFVTISSAEFVLRRDIHGAKIRQKLLSDCSSFDSNHPYHGCQNPIAFTSLIKPYIDSLRKVSEGAKNVLYLVAHQDICLGQPLTFPEGNNTAEGLYRAWIGGLFSDLH